MRSPLRLIHAAIAAAMCSIVATDEAHTEQRIQELGLTRGPRIAPNDIDNVIVGTEYHHFAPTTTVCCLTLLNGFTVIGHSACVSPENYNEGLGREIAFDNARDQVGQLEGYLLAQQINVGGRSMTSINIPNFLRKDPLENYVPQRSTNQE